MKEQVLIFDPKDKESLYNLRNEPGILAGLDSEGLWVRGLPAHENSRINITSLPSLHHYYMDDVFRLYPGHKPTPVAILPDLKWTPIKTFLPLEIPVAAMPGQLRIKYKIQLVNSGDFKQPTALIAQLDTWKKYADSASEIRLSILKFAANKEKKVLITGDLLPPIPGESYWLSNDILIPSGIDFDPPLLARLISKKLNPMKDRYLIFNKKGSIDMIPKSDLVTATRSGIRLTNPQ